MKTKVLSSTFYPTTSSEIILHQNSADPPFRYNLQKAAIFTQEITFNEKGNQGGLKQKSGWFSMEKLTYQKFKEQKEMLENARLPTFNIKKLIDRSAKKRKDLKMHEKSGSGSPSPTKKLEIKENQLKDYWANYLNNQISHLKLPQNIRRNLTPLIRKQKKSQSEMKKFPAQGSRLDTPLANNFLKTNYRKRRMDSKHYLKNQLSLKERMGGLSRIDESDTANWMVPWERFEENQEPNFNVL